jgi:predicted PurR-regulated permease PerM
VIHPAETMRRRPQQGHGRCMPDPEVRQGLPPWSLVVLGVAGGSVAVWGMHAAAPLLGPVLLAFVLTVVAHPLVGVLVRRGTPRWLAVAVLVLVVDGGVIAISLAVLVSLGQLATVLPQYSEQWQQLLDGVRNALSAAGVGQDQVQQILHAVEPGSVLALLGRVLSGAVGALAALVLVVVTALFMAVDAAGLPQRLAAVPGRSLALQAALADFARNTRRYIVVTTIFGFAVAVVDTVGLLLLGVPLPLLWGLLSFLTNYVPNIGFVIGLVPPVLLALLSGGPGVALLVVVIYCGANLVLQSLIQPLFVGDAVGLSVTLTFLSTLVWTLVLGPVGAILAVPLTLFCYCILVAQDPDRRWARALLSGSLQTQRQPSAGTSRRARSRGATVATGGESSAVDDADGAREDHPRDRTTDHTDLRRSRP